MPALAPKPAAAAVARTHAWWLLPVAAALVAWCRVPWTGFAQDDFRWLLRASEHAPIGLGTPRVLSLGVWFRAGLAAFGANPVAFHVAQLAMHAATALLLYRVLGRRMSAGRAAVGAVLFLTSPALFDALHWTSAITDVMCGLGLAIAAWLVIEHGRDRGSEPLAWLAVVAHALAMLAKETAVGAAPALALIHGRCGDRTARARIAVTLAIAALVATRAAGAWQTGTGEPYALAPAAALLNLPGYVAAAALGGLAASSPSDLLWARQIGVIAAGAALLLLWIGALIVRRSPGAWPGFIWFIGVLAPVLFLERQFHFFYLYAALPGLVLSVSLLAAGAARAEQRWVAVALAVFQIAAIEARSTARLPSAPLPTDFVLRRALIAGNALADLAPHRDALRARVVMLGQQPVEEASQGRSTADTTAYRRDPWWDENVKAALADGEALRLMQSSVREVAFERWLEPADSSATILAYRIDGHLAVSDYRAFVGAPSAASATTAERLARAGELIRRRLFREAEAELRRARAGAPDDADVLLNLGAVEAALGDSTRALETLSHALRVVPDDLDVGFNLGLLQWRMGRRDEARRSWSRLLREAPDSDLGRAARDLIAGRSR
jgi:Flp pilus assembly protein TadD